MGTVDRTTHGVKQQGLKQQGRFVKLRQRRIVVTYRQVMGTDLVSFLTLGSLGTWDQWTGLPRGRRVCQVRLELTRIHSLPIMDARSSTDSGAVTCRVLGLPLGSALVREAHNLTMYQVKGAGHKVVTYRQVMGTNLVSSATLGSLGTQDRWQGRPERSDSMQTLVCPAVVRVSTDSG